LTKFRNFAKSNFFQGVERLSFFPLHVFAKTNISVKILAKINIFPLICQITCHQNIFTKWSLFHMLLTRVAFFVRNLRKVYIFVIFSYFRKQFIAKMRKWLSRQFSRNLELVSTLIGPVALDLRAGSESCPSLFKLRIKTNSKYFLSYDALR
jgi:hypothetical protein